MKQSIFGTLGKGIMDFAEKNGRIVGGIAVVGGVIATAVLAYNARPKVDEIISESKEKAKEIEEQVDEDGEEISEEKKSQAKKELTKETAKKIARVALPTVLVGLATIATDVAVVYSGEKSIRDLSSMVVAGDIAYKELFDKTREMVGDEKAAEIKREIEEDHIEEDKVWPAEENMVEYAGGPHLFWDAMSRRWFSSSAEHIREVVAKCNKRLSSGQEPYLTLNEFYTELGVATIPLGEGYAWGGFTYSSTLEPCMNDTVRTTNGSATILDWYVRPMTNYRAKVGDF